MFLLWTISTSLECLISTKPAWQSYHLYWSSIHTRMYCILIKNFKEMSMYTIFPKHNYNSISYSEYRNCLCPGFCTQNHTNIPHLLAYKVTYCSIVTTNVLKSMRYVTLLHFKYFVALIQRAHNLNPTLKLDMGKSKAVLSSSSNQWQIG